MIKKTLLPLFLFFAVSAYAQNTIEAKELSKKEIRKLIKAEKRKKEIADIFKGKGVKTSKSSLGRKLKE